MSTGRFHSCNWFYEWQEENEAQQLNFIFQTKYINEGPKNHTSKSHLTSMDFSIISIWRICESKREKREEIDRVQEYDNKTTKEHVKT